MRLITLILLLAPAGSLTIPTGPANDNPDNSPSKSGYHHPGQHHPDEINNKDNKRDTHKWRIGPCQLGGGHRNCTQECLATAAAECVETKGSQGWLGCSTQRSEVLQCWCTCTV